MRALLACGLLAGAACATSGPRPMGARALEELGMRRYHAPPDELYDAAWLAFEKLGLRVVAHDRRAGSFETQEDPQRTGAPYAWTAQVEQEQDTVRLQLLPLRRGPAAPDAPWPVDGPGGLEDRVRAVHAQVQALLDAWREGALLAYDTQHHDVGAAGVRVALPAEWGGVELRTDRRRLQLVRKPRQPRPVVPTMAVEVDRRRPVPVPEAGAGPAAPRELAPSLEAVALAAARDARLDVQGPLASWAPRAGKVGDLAYWTFDVTVDADPAARLFAFWTETAAWTVRVVAVCGRDAPDACDDELRALVQGVVVSPSR